MPSARAKVAVITGGANGIGRALAERAGAGGLAVALLDVDAEALRDVTASLVAQGVSAHALTVDVTDREAMIAAAARVDREIGDTALLVNNAGVFLAAPFRDVTPAQWEFVLGVNLWGVVHGLHAFLPAMLSRDEGHVVNVSSVDGIVTVPNAAIYNASKHAVTALTETLYREHEAAGSNVGVSLLCPGAVATDIVNSARHWPSRLGPGPTVERTEYPPLEGVMAPARVAEITFAAIAERRFWILTHPDQYAAAIRARADGIVVAANPDDDTVDPNFRRDSGRVPQ